MAMVNKVETTPLMQAYSTQSHAKMAPCTYGVSEIVMDYNPWQFSSLRVFGALRGSICQDPVLLIEQLILSAIFAACAIPVYILFNQKGTVGSDNESMRKWVDNQEARMRLFAIIMTQLASFLLAFYTAMSVGRWWMIRTCGVGGIKAAAMELEMLVSQMVTQDEDVLGAIRRYARTSLILIFLWRRKRLDFLQEELVEGDPKLLTPDEAAQLLKWNHCLHETIWAWQSAIVCMLWNEKKIQSEQLLRKLMEKVSDGRAAVQCIHTHLAVKIPMQYVHLLGFLVKSHNVVLAVIMGTLFGAAVRNGETIICVQLVGRTLILPVLFNAILLINAELSDPFDGHSTDFPGWAYQNAIEKDGAGFVKAGQNMPAWMKRRNPLPV